MLITFQLQKSVQAAAVLLKTEPDRRMSRLRLLKLLYVADREALKETGRMITCDRVVAMDHGPVLSSVYDLIKGQHASAPTWEHFIVRDGARNVALKEEPGVDRLSRYELAKLSDVAKRFGDADDWKLAEYTHQFSEWSKNKPDAGSCRRIPLDDLLAAVGLLEVKDQLLRDAAAEAKVEHLLSF